MTPHDSGLITAEVGRPSYLDIVRQLGAAQKPAARGAPAYSRFINRPLGRLIAAGAYKAGLNPDAVTSISAAFTFAGLALVATVHPGWAMSVGVSMLLVFGYALDSADGQVARLRGTSSAAGEWLDHIVDSVKVVTLPAVVLLAYSRWDLAGSGWQVALLAMVVVGSVHFFSMILTEQLRRAHGKVPLAGDSSPRRALIRSLAVLPADYGVLCLAFVLLAVPSVFLVIYLVLGAFTALLLGASLLRWYRELAALTRPSATQGESQGAGARRVDGPDAGVAGQRDGAATAEPHDSDQPTSVGR